jgi:hypothetical protein
MVEAAALRFRSMLVAPAFNDPSTTSPTLARLRTVTSTTFASS